jgi:hypothetical protein
VDAADARVCVAGEFESFARRVEQYVLLEAIIHSLIRTAGEFWRCLFGFSKSKRAKSEAYRFGFSLAFIRKLVPQLQGIQLGESEKRLIAMLTSGELSHPSVNRPA